jgi:hypothetical protein
MNTVAQPKPQPPARPVNCDDALRLITPGCCFVQGETNVPKAKLLADTRADIAAAEWFDFGRVDMTALQGQYETAEALLRADVPMPPPYPFSVFRYRAHNFPNFPDEPHFETEEIILIVSRRASKADAQYMAGRPMSYDPPGLVAPFLFLRRFLFLTDACMLIDRCTSFGTEVAGLEQVSSLNTIAAYFGLWAMLNTKNIRTRVNTPHPRLQKARAKSGKPALKRVTYIDTAQFEEAARAPHVPGHHASPRMHLRRGHLWTLPSGLGKRWRRHCIVNARGEPAKRDHYQLQQGDSQ